MEELRQHEDARRREAVRSRQLAEVLSVEEAHMLEFNQFNKLWDTKMGMYEQQAVGLMGAMKERHAAELREFQQKLIARGTQTRHSKEYHNLRKVQETLARQKK
jgi:hypothetical protein